MCTDLPLELSGYRIRDYRDADVEPICRLANSIHVVRWLSDAFPYPYTADDAQKWLGKVADQDPTRDFAIAGPDGLCGGIGLMLKNDPNYEHDGEIGFWLGRPYWNRGIATAAVRAFTAWSRAAFRLHRISARVFAPNEGSARVLTRCGFHLEGTLRQAAKKEGHYLDLLVFGHLPGDGHTGTT